MKILYIAKGTKTDSIVGCGLTWTEGETKEVTPQLAEKLLVFPDTWEVVYGDVLDKGDSKGKTKVNTPKKEDLIDLEPTPKVERNMPVVNFGIMDKDTVTEYIRRNYNEDLNTNKPLVEIRQDALAVFHRKENQILDELEEADRRNAETAERAKQAALTG